MTENPKGAKEGLLWKVVGGLLLAVVGAVARDLCAGTGARQWVLELAGSQGANAAEAGDVELSVRPVTRQRSARLLWLFPATYTTTYSIEIVNRSQLARLH
jgi:hypothetical protein